jgi:hypothetical protein
MGLLVYELKTGKIFESIMYSLEPMYLRHFQSIHVQLRKKSIDAQERMKRIESGSIAKE